MRTYAYAAAATRFKVSGRQHQRNGLGKHAKARKRTQKAANLCEGMQNPTEVRLGWHRGRGCVGVLCVVSLEYTCHTQGRKLLELLRDNQYSVSI